MAASTIGTVVLDTGPLGLISSPQQKPLIEECKHWLETLLARNVRVAVPEICDYEVRRELLRAGKTQGLANLDTLCAALDYLPLDTSQMRRAAQLWADIRSANLQTADPHALDGDVILAAQTLALNLPTDQIVIATSNPAHLSRFVTAKTWQEIS